MGNNGQIAEWLVGPSDWSNRDSGALVIGGDYRSLGTVRSLGRRNIPVWVLTDQHLIAGVSRYARRRFRWPQADEETQVEYLINLNAQHGLLGWVLVPSSDETAATVARYHTTLRERFRLTIPPWEVLQWAYDKRLTCRLASMLGIPYPWTHTLASREEAAEIACPFPAVLKPAVKPTLNAFTIAKAWRVEDRQSLLASYDKACTMVDPGVIMIQELIPGGGEEQFSFAALCLDGRPLAKLVARRTRQYPVDFGRSSTFVETVDQYQIEDAGRRQLHVPRLSRPDDAQHRDRHGRHRRRDVLAHLVPQPRGRHVRRHGGQQRDLLGQPRPGCADSPARQPSHAPR